MAPVKCVFSCIAILYMKYAAEQQRYSYDYYINDGVYTNLSSMNIIVSLFLKY